MKFYRRERHFGQERGRRPALATVRELHDEVPTGIVLVWHCIGDVEAVVVALAWP